MDVEVGKVGQMRSRPILGQIGRAKFQDYIFYKYKINQRGLKSKFDDLREIHQIRYFAKLGGEGVEGLWRRGCDWFKIITTDAVHFC